MIGEIVSGSNLIKHLLDCAGGGLFVRGAGGRGSLCRFLFQLNVAGLSHDS